MTRVLIVEDERLVARELQIRLEENGYRVTGNVASADNALRAASEQVPDIVLMDIHIQGERDGIETAALLQQQFDVPVVFLTAHSDEATVQRAKQIGAAGYLIKPPKERELVVTLEVARHKHEMSRQLREREKWYSTTLRSIGDAVVSTDAAGNVTFMNSVAEVLTGWRAEEARGQPASTVLQLARTGGDAEAPIAESVRRKETIHVDGTLTDQTGRRRAISDSASPIVDESGALLGGVIVFRDVTEKRAIERQLEATERLASLSTLAAGVAHEINNPLTWVLANLTHLTEVIASPSITGDQLAALREEAAETLAGAQRIQHVVRDLLAFSRRGPGRNNCLVAAAIQQAIDRTHSPVAITVEVEGPITVAIDETRLVQVLGNVLANAVQAIIDAPLREHRIAIRATATAAETMIAVADTGIGMEEAVRVRVFEPFFTTKAKARGAGLGLSIAHGLVSAAGGRMAMSTALGTGTVCTIVLPTYAPTPVPAPTTAPVTRARILVIDDEESMRRLIKRVLRMHDVVAVEAPEAWRLLHAGERYDVILCDVMMPDIGGVELYERVLSLDPAQASRMAFVTGGAFNLRSTEFLATTKNRVLEKPFVPADLVALVNEHLGAKT